MIGYMSVNTLERRVPNEAKSTDLDRMKRVVYIDCKPMPKSCFVCSRHLFDFVLSNHLELFWNYGIGSDGVSHAKSYTRMFLLASISS